MNNKLQTDLENFREEEKELFDKNGKRYTGVNLSIRQAEMMLKLINDFEKEVIRLEVGNKILNLMKK